MTDHIGGYIVVLDHSVREDDADDTLNALRMVKGVIKVEPLVEDFNTHIAEGRVGAAWRKRLLEVAIERVR